MPKCSRTISLDCETTGVDLHHGAKPFLVTVCDEVGNQTFWEWPVDPLTREPQIPEQDRFDIAKVIREADQVIGQNIRFDAAALKTIGIWDWPWDRTQDTLIAGHLLASNQPHDLTTMVLVYLGRNIKPLEDDLEVAVKEARKLVKREFSGEEDLFGNAGAWRVAKAGLPEMPSAKESTWRFDYWLPKAVAKAKGYADDHPWQTVLSEYANTDSASTLLLFKRQEDLLKKRGLWEIYLERLKLLPVVAEIETNGLTISCRRTEELKVHYQVESAKIKAICLKAADNEIADLPVNGVSNDLRRVIFGKFKLRPTKTTKKGNDSLDKYVLEDWAHTLPEGPAKTFVVGLRQYRKRATALGFIEAYQKFWLSSRDVSDTHILHSLLNPTGTGTLRFSSSNPNGQQIGKQEIEEMTGGRGHSARYMFGPAPGREWCPLDAQNIELRLPAYEAGEQAMIDLFEKPDEAPYFGSNHLLVAHVLWPKEFNECLRKGLSFKDHYKSTLYQWVKNGNFAVQYGAMLGSGTADRAYHQIGAQAKIMKRFTKIAALNQRVIAFADKHGYVETIPDRTVNPKHGYPLLCTRSAWGKVVPTVPLSYHIQGTAMWWMCKAMVRCHAQLKEWPDCRMVLQVHDEIVFDLPKGQGKEPWKTNLPKVRKLANLMAQGGDDIGVPTPVSIEYCANNWGEGKVIK